MVPSFSHNAAPAILLWVAGAAFYLLQAQTTPGTTRQIGGLPFQWIPAGAFQMGSPPDEPERRADEGPVNVTITRGFWLGKYEVTQAEWTRVMGAFPREQDKGTGPDVPVYWITWNQATEFCRRLTVKAHADGSLPQDWEIRLPTEAQWEYACRAGTRTATSFGPTLNRTQANIGSPYPGGNTRNNPGKSVKVGTYPANAWGLHDMHGSVWEWCLDWYHRQLPGGPDPDLSNKQGEQNRDGTYSRVRRGGAWPEDGWANRSAMRLRYEPERNSDHIGFRAAAVRVN